MTKILNSVLVATFTIAGCGRIDQASQNSQPANETEPVEQVQTFVGLNQGGECGLSLMRKEQKVVAYKSWGWGISFEWNIVQGKSEEQDLVLENKSFYTDKPTEFTNPFNGDTIIHGKGYFNDIVDIINIIGTTNIVLKGGRVKPTAFSVKESVSAAIVIRGHKIIECKL